MTHASLFSGIGGFDLAAAWMNWQNIFQVEIDPYCQLVLKKHFPHAQRHNDIHTFDGAQYAGRIDIISGGFPCQPYSHAGKRKGNADDRALWPEMLRVIREVGPTWVVGENVAGLLSMDGGRVFDGIITDLENLGYQTQAFVIPAVGVGAPHKRDRLWIVAHRDGGDGAISEQPQEGRVEGSDTYASGKNSPTPNTERIRRNRWPPAQSGHVFGNWKDGKRQGAGEFTGTPFATADSDCQRECKQEYEAMPVPCGRATRKGVGVGNWSEHWLPVATRLCRMDDGISSGLDGTGLLPAPTKNKKAAGRSHRLKALGNAIVPQVAYQIFQAIQHTFL